MNKTGGVAHFVIGASEGNEGFVCTFFTENGTEVLVSGTYATAADAAIVAGLIKSHAGTPDRYQRIDEVSGIASFCVSDSSGNELARSLGFSTRLARELAIERTMMSAPTAAIVDD